MSYSSQAQLAGDSFFAGRCSACLTEQAEVFINDTRGDIKQLATDWLRRGAPNVSAPNLISVWLPILAAEPGLAEGASDDNTVDSSRITDEQILSAVQARYPQVAGLLYEPDGSPRT